MSGRELEVEKRDSEPMSFCGCGRCDKHCPECRLKGTLDDTSGSLTDMLNLSECNLNPLVNKILESSVAGQ